MRKQNFVPPLVAALAFAGTAHAAGGTTTSGTGTASSTAIAADPAPRTGPQLNSLASPPPVRRDIPGTPSGGTSTGTSTNTNDSSPSGTGLAPSSQTSGALAGTVEVPLTPLATEPVGTVISDNGERVAVNTVGIVLPAPAAPVPTPTLTAAERAAQQRIRAKTARQQQLMHSITPRTNNDRTDQMPDDPIIVP